MSKVILEIDNKQVEKMVESLPIEEKLILVRKLEKDTRRERWDKLFKIIDERFKKHPITRSEIDKEIELARKEHYAKRRH